MHTIWPFGILANLRPLFRLQKQATTQIYSQSHLSPPRRASDREIYSPYRLPPIWQARAANWFAYAHLVAALALPGAEAPLFSVRRCDISSKICSNMAENIPSFAQCWAGVTSIHSPSAKPSSLGRQDVRDVRECISLSILSRGKLGRNTMW